MPSTAGELNFDKTFLHLTGKAPFPWQRAMYERFVSGRSDNIPAMCNLPTGLGKTSVVAIWLIAVAQRPTQIPRRLVYVVNRRTVVDQTSIEAVNLRNQLADNPSLDDLKARLKALCSRPLLDDEQPLSISTLRGQYADNAEWRQDPARPAVIVGTVDMIGSRLLFSGYGVGYRSRPTHAGLLAQDVLLVHDEAHLEPAFQGLLSSIESEQQKCRDPRPLRVMELSATTRGDESNVQPFTLTDNDLEDPTVMKRVHAKKWMGFHHVEDEKKIHEIVATLALNHLSTGKAILVFLRRLDDVEKVVVLLRKKTDKVEQLTGTKRGYERDELAKSNLIFDRFLPKVDRAEKDSLELGTVYLVCTSAGEVGVNISGDHMICDLSPFESMAQRLGRVNRFGEGDALIEVVHPGHFDEKDRLGPARAATLELLRRLPSVGERHNASPFSLGNLPAGDRKAAYSPPPCILNATDILFDAWALTTVRDRMPGRPPVADWLHGVDEGTVSETYVAWREEVDLLSGFYTELLLEDFLEDYPLKPHELLRDQTPRVFGHLEMVAKRHPERKVWIVSADGTVRILTMNQLVAKDNQKRPFVNLDEQTIVLSVAVGGLSSSGLLDGDSDRPVRDVADEWFDEKGGKRRVRVQDEPPPNKWRLVHSFDSRLLDNDGSDSDDEIQQRRYWYVNPKSADDDGSRFASEPQQLNEHLEQARLVAQQIVLALHLPEPEGIAVELAAGWHDLGKNRAVWQSSIGNREYSRGVVLAKSKGRMSSIELNSYRHEFGSVLDVKHERRVTLPELTDDVRELILHLIAAHHGRGRPHFPTNEASDPKATDADSRDLAIEVLQRFCRLQRKYGRWGLAWMESLVRAADALASQGVK